MSSLAPDRLPEDNLLKHLERRSNLQRTVLAASIRPTMSTAAVRGAQAHRAQQLFAAASATSSSSTARAAAPRAAKALASSRAFSSDAALREPTAFSRTAPCLAASADASKPGAARRGGPSSPNSASGSGFQAAPLSSPAPPHSTTPYSKATVSIVRGLARLLGYNRMGSAAIRTTSDMYDRCAEAAELQQDFWYQGELSFRHDVFWFFARE